MTKKMAAPRGAPSLSGESAKRRGVNGVRPRPALAAKPVGFPRARPYPPRGRRREKRRLVISLTKTGGSRSERDPRSRPPGLQQRVGRTQWIDSAKRS